MQQQEASKRMDFTTQNNQKGKEGAKAEEGKDLKPEGGKYKGVDKDEQGRHKKVEHDKVGNQPLRPSAMDDLEGNF